MRETIRSARYYKSQEQRVRGGIAYACQGDSGNKARREAHERAWALLEVVSGIYRANLDFGVPNVLWTSLTTAQPDITSTEAGTEVLIPFTIHYEARI